MKTIGKHEIKMVAGGVCLCRCRQYHTENYTQTHWYMFNSKKYENIVVGHAKDVADCLEICTTMMEGNLFKTCMTLVEKEKGWGKPGALEERKTGL